MKKILFPTDFSKRSLDTLPFVASFAQKTGAELHLFHAMLAPVIQSDGPMLSSQELMQDQQDQAEDRLEKLAETIREKQQINVRIAAEYGFSAETIADAAKRKEVDLIVLSDKGESNILDKLFGNVTVDLFEKSSVPILSLPEKAKLEEINQVAFASSNIDYDTKEIFDLVKLTENFKPAIKLVHITDGKAFKRESFEEYNNLEYVEIKGEEDESKASTFLDYLNENKIDLVCVKKYKLPFFYRLFHKSFTEKLFHHSNIPLLVFKDK